MQADFDNINLLFPTTINWELWKQYSPDEPFSNKVIAFLNALSVSLLKDSSSRAYPDIITFAFFCRKASIFALKKQHQKDGIRLGRGILFHIAPSNVPVNFGYSLVSGLLSGNQNVVRVSSKEFQQVDLILKHIYNLSGSEKYKEIANRIVVIRYDRNSNATDFFSSFCNVRVIWGGDETIAQIRKSSIPARSFDVTFADRYSLAFINANELIKEINIHKLTEGFYNDTYLFDQNACSAPHLIIWSGTEKCIREAKEKFWNAVYEEVNKKYQFQTILAVDKLTAFYRQAINMSVRKERGTDNSLVRIFLDKLPENIDDFRCAGGYFSEYIALSLNDIVPIINNKYQTLAYYGFDKDTLIKFIENNHIIGIDRIVPIGSTTDFSLTWDGYNLIDTFTRTIDIL
jgi:hypothetical protein